jgi:hypothetical protein
MAGNQRQGGIMKRLNAGVLLGLFLAAAGVFLLLKNLGAFKEWGDAIWGGVFALVGLAFLGWFVADRSRWWRALAGTTLLGGGLVILLGWRGIGLGDWGSALVLFGIALGFWITAIAQGENWWAVIPAGALTLMAILLGLRSRNLSEQMMMAIVFLGLAAVFGLAYLARARQGDSRWAAIPAVALLLMGLVSLVNTFGETSLVARWWPIVLVVLGIGVFFIAFARQGLAEPVVEGPSFPAHSPAPGASITQSLPDAPAPSPRPGDESTDIYKLISEQPPEPKQPA